ncbi:MAG: sulfatase-like hydrolase/transferase [Pirellulaceae bacterium]|jgi:hypothetical protein|nr:sulfatase-like hydrolase/transferase [Pirellulaceae bacterium]MDP7019661.1 sulfatase-like hydrolase/transferase [Pirellulaceae bacterium]
MVRTLRGIVAATLLLLLCGVVWVRVQPHTPVDAPTAAIGGERQLVGDPAGRDPAGGGAEWDGEAGADDAGRPPARNPLIGGIEGLIGESPVFDEEGEALLDDLDRADRLLGKIKDENRRALERLNRPRPLRNPPPDDRPHILFVELGQVGVGELDIYGGDSKRAPFLSQLAQQGVAFTAFTPATDALTSRTRLWTGGSDAPLRDDRPGQLLRALDGGNYYNVLIGECQVTSRWATPSEVGFDRWFGFPDRRRRSPFPESVVDTSSEIRVLANRDGKRGQHAHDLFFQEALALFKNPPPGKRLFVHLAWSYPNTEWPATESGEAAAAWESKTRKWDGQLAALATQLNASRLAHNMVIVLTSFEPRTVTDGGNSPLIVLGPNRIRKNRLDKQSCTIDDLAATIADLAGARVSSSGRSLVGRLSN